MATAEQIQEMTDRLVRRFDPLRVILFGSHARQTNRPDSDVDLLVVLASCKDKRQARVDARDALRDLLVAKDVVVTTPEDIADRSDLVGSVLRPALREGKVLYDRG
jgi:uncharacterized protein